MFDLRELYQELILEHCKRPRHFCLLAGANCKVEGYNPLCGDQLTLYLDLDNEWVRDISFQGSGCAISTASASMLTESVQGKTRAEAEAPFERFHHLVTGKSPATAEDPALGDLVVFAGVAEFPMRVKCATLAWHALRAALHGEGDMVSTE
jgi:nitrogen fixation protein NifU and related proteins